MTDYAKTNSLDLTNNVYDTEVIKYPNIYMIKVNLTYDPPDALILNTNIKWINLCEYGIGPIICTSPIAKLQNICRLSYNDKIYLTWNNYCITNSISESFSEDIEYVNIAETNTNFDVILPFNFPVNVKILKIEVKCSEKWLSLLLSVFSNLPTNLEKLIISFDNTDNARGWGDFFDREFIKTLNEKIKLPHNCKLIIDPYVRKFVY